MTDSEFNWYEDKTYVLTNEICEKYNEAAQFVKDADDFIDRRVDFILNKIVKLIDNSDKPGSFTYRWNKVSEDYPHHCYGDDCFDDRSSFLMIKNDFFHYNAYTFSGGHSKLLFCLENGETIDLLDKFPTSWLYNKSFEEELIAGREKYIQLKKESDEKSEKEKQESEEKLAKQQVIISNIKERLSQEELEALGLNK